eukprot:1554215-Rhodomonas_salina.1
MPSYNSRSPAALTHTRNRHETRGGVKGGEGADRRYCPPGRTWGPLRYNEVTCNRKRGSNCIRIFVTCRSSFRTSGNSFLQGFTAKLKLRMQAMCDRIYCDTVAGALAATSDDEWELVAAPGAEETKWVNTLNFWCLPPPPHHLFSLHSVLVRFTLQKLQLRAGSISKPNT